MSGKTPRLVGSIAFVVTLLVSGIDVGMPDTARADDCLTAPNSPAPQGTHWYYHVDRTNQRKCWYVRASSQPAQQAAAQATSEAAPAAQSHSMPVSSGPMPATAGASAPMSISPGNSAPRLPHVRILAVKPKLAAAISATTDKSVQGSGQEGSTGPSIPEPPAPKASTSLQLTLRRLGRRLPLLRHGPMSSPRLLRSGHRSPARSWPMPARSPAGLKRTLRCRTEQRALPGAVNRRSTLGWRAL